MSDGPNFGIRHTMPERLALMRRIVEAQARPGLRVLEVGAYEGESALVWSTAVAELCGTGSVLCVDPWRSYVSEEDVLSQPVCGAINEELASGAVFEQFLSNTRFASLAAPIYYRVGTLKETRSYLATLPPFDVAYIDGDHVYDQVRSDIEVAGALLRVGGVLCGDDLERQLHECNLEEVTAQRHRNWVGYHPGVTLAVGEAFPVVWVESGFWAMRKTETGWEPFA